jgi:hypothetical protein
MGENTLRDLSEEKAMEIAEASRQADVRDPGFLKELFLRNYWPGPSSIRRFLWAER